MKFYTYKHLIQYKSIRNKTDLIKLLLNIFTPSNLQLIKNKEDVTVIMQMEKTINRIYIFENENVQIQSFHSPFILHNDKGGGYVQLENSIFPDCIDEVVISFLKTFFNSYIEYESNFEDFMNNFMDYYYEIIIDENKIKNYWNLVLYLLSFDSGYIRYDYDPANSNGKVHPLYHLDVNYNDNATYKIGLETHCTYQMLLDMVSRQTNCKYLKF